MLCCLLFWFKLVWLNWLVDFDFTKSIYNTLIQIRETKTLRNFNNNNVKRATSRNMDTVFLIDSQEEFQKAIEEIVNYYCSSNPGTHTPKSSTDKESAKDDIKKILQDSNFNINKVPELLVHKGWNEQKIAYFVKKLNEKKSELLYASLNNHNSEFGETITKFDWLLKLVLGTSELNNLKYPLLQLVLSTESNGIQEKMLYDLNKDTVLKLITTLEKLDDYVDT